MTKKSSTPAIRFKGFTDTWEQRKLGELGTITTGNTPSTSIPDYYSDDGIVWVTPTDICENITFESARKLSDLGQQVGRVVPKNTILVTCIASIGKNTMLGNTGSFNQQINGLTPNENKYDPYFLLTESALWSAKMKGSAASGTMQIVNRTEFSELKTWLTSLIEQQAIGAFFKQLDNLITLHQRKYDKLTNVKKSMLEKMFPKNGSNVPEIRFKGFTEAWEQRKVSELFRVTRGYVLAATQTETTKTDEKPYPVYSSQTKDKGLMGYYKDYLYEDAITWTTDGANAGTVNYRAGKFYCTNVCGVLLSNEVKANQMIAEALNSVAKGYVSYVGNPKLMNNVMADIVIQIPTQAEEREQLSSFFAKLDNLITLHQRELEKLKNLKKACLEKMFV